jgi:hypothetical protein
MIWIAGALFGVQVVVLLWGWQAIDGDQRMSFSLGVPPSIQGTTSKRTGLVLRALVACFLFSGSLLAHLQGDTFIIVIGALLLGFFSVLDVLNVRRMTGHNRDGLP